MEKETGLSPDAQRIQDFLTFIKKSKNAAGLSIGDKNGMRFQHVLSGRNTISEKLATAIVETYPYISYAWLLRGEGEMVNSDAIQVRDPSQPYANKNGNVFEEVPNGKLRIFVKKVGVKAFGSYLMESQDSEFMESLPEVSFTVDHYAKGNYLCFEVAGDSMNGGGIDDAPDGAELLCRELQRHHWKDGFRDSKYGWVIVHNDTVIYKDIKSLDNETGDIVCHSRSGLPQHPDFTINLNDVRQIWKVIKRSF